MIWELIQDDRCLSELSEDYSPSRWKVWTDRFAYYFESFDVLLLIVLYILVTRGVIKNFGQDVPGLVNVQKYIDSMGGVHAPDDAADLDLKSLKEASKALETKRHKGCGSLLVVAESLQNLLTRRLGVVVGEVPKLFEEKMMRDITQCKTQAGSSNWHIHQACGGQIDTVKKTFGLLEDWAFLDMAGFKLPDQILDSAAHKEDDVVAKFAWDFIKHICVNEVKSSSFYHDRPPYMF